MLDTTIPIIKVKHLSKSQWRQINALWNEEYPVQLKDKFGLLLEGVTAFNHYLLEEKEIVIAWAVDFEKEGETRFSLIVKKEYQGKGLGSTLINRLKVDLGVFYGWVIDHEKDQKQNGDFYTSPLPFYIHHGFVVLTEQRIDSNILSAVKIKRK
jgi:GNAT superfamily N-acetyltransferase